MPAKDLLIHSIQEVRVDGDKNIPTALYYLSPDKYSIGVDALSATEDVATINQDFKIDLGHYNSERANKRQTFFIACGAVKSAYALTQDFLFAVLKHLNAWLEARQVGQAAQILIAEPLRMHDEEDAQWLENYRKNLRDLLERRTSDAFPAIAFDTVSFLPEPFAVFQYYRYGLRHPLMTENIRHHALVLDFGGGTFDACVIQTTKEGNISGSGRNSLPFGAASAAVGGFFVNREIARYLYETHVVSKERKSEFRKAYKMFTRWRKEGFDFESMRAEHQAFARNMLRSSLELERAKLALCKGITDWSLDAQLTGQTKVSVPIDGFSECSGSKSVPFSATELRDIFLTSVWDTHLRDVVKHCLNRALHELAGQRVSIVLLSGGSANIGWLKTALYRDFEAELSDAQTLTLPDFQEVVSKGLAVECARRFYTEDGDFGSITYNRLCLMLDVHHVEGSSDCQPRNFKPVTENLPTPDCPGVLLPSASGIRSFIDKPMVWKVRVGASPKRLDYFFLRSSFDPEDLESRFNFEETTVYAPLKALFDKHLRIELVVKEDGTALPRFVYHVGRSESETQATAGRAFALDATCRAQSSGAKAYVGLDFGSSNTAVAFVDSTGVEEYHRRLGDASWGELSDLAYELPYPIADAVLDYLAETGSPDRVLEAARRAAEAMLAMLFYAAVADHRSSRQEASIGGRTKLLGSLSQRSAGPLWGALRQLFDEQRFWRRALFTACLKELVHGDTRRVLDEFVNSLAQAKHEKTLTCEHKHPVQLLANYSRRVFCAAQFGFFQNVKKARYSREFVAEFRVATGKAPFIRVEEVELVEPVAELTPYLWIRERGVAVSLCPMVVWRAAGGSEQYDHGCCHLYDSASKAGDLFSYKTVGRAAQLEVSLASQDVELQMLAKMLQAELKEDGKIEIVKVSPLCTGSDGS